MKMNILLVEDSQDCQLLVTKILGDHRIQIIDDPDQVMNMLDNHKFDIILLDLSLPKRDGFSVLQEVQSHKTHQSIPVICLTGKDQISDKVTAFSLGADDYIQKPFNPIELRARVESRLAKVRKSTPLAMNLGAVTVDFTSHRVTVDNGREIVLTQTEFKLLTHMGRHPGNVFTREQLLAAVWGDDGAVFDRAVDVHICSLRKKLNGYQLEFKSVSGVGYKLALASSSGKKAS